MASSQLQIPHSRRLPERRHFAKHFIHKAIRSLSVNVHSTYAFSDVKANQHILPWLQSWGNDCCIYFQKYFYLWLQLMYLFKHPIPTEPMNILVTENISLIWFPSIGRVIATGPCQNGQICFRLSARPVLFFPRFLRISKLGLLFDERRGLSTTGHFPLTGSDCWLTSCRAITSM
jgi:hypothetical protein